jgi:hypothetical protein
MSVRMRRINIWKTSTFFWAPVHAVWGLGFSYDYVPLVSEDYLFFIAPPPDVPHAPPVTLPRRGRAERGEESLLLFGRTGHPHRLAAIRSLQPKVHND